MVSRYNTCAMNQYCDFILLSFDYPGADWLKLTKNHAASHWRTDKNLKKSSEIIERRQQK